MKKIILNVFLAMVCEFCLAADLYHPVSSDIIASSYGSRNGVTLTNIVAQVGTRRVNLILDGGQWNIENNVTFPSNVTVTVSPGCPMAVTNAVTVTFQNNDLICGHWPAFTTLGTTTGTVTGTANFLYRIEQWGATNIYNIGYGDLSNIITTANLKTNVDLLFNFPSDWVRTSISNTFATNTTQSLWDLIVRRNATVASNLVVNGTLTVNGVPISGTSSNTTAYNLQYDGTNSPNYLTHFMGYPKLAIDLSQVASVKIDGTAISNNSFYSVIDGDLDTHSSTGTVHDEQSLYVDLGAVYSGYFIVKMHTYSYPASMLYAMTYSMTNTTEHGHLVAGFGNNEYCAQGWNYYLDTPSVFLPVVLIQPFTGRSVGIWVTSLLTAGTTVSYNTKFYVNEIMVYGVTNGFNNFSGSL
jgi:hypothetical protein